MEKIILIGGGGHCKVIIDCIKSNNSYNIIGILDANKKGDNILGIPVLGDDSCFRDIYKEGIKNAFVCVGGLLNMPLRDTIYYNLKKIGFNIPVIIHEKSYVSPYSKVMSGSCVMAGAIINPGSFIDENCIINTGSIIEHDCHLERNVHLGPGAKISGGDVIGYNSHIGIGSCVIQGINVGNNVIIGAGAVVIRDVADFETVVGVPAKSIKCR